MLIRLAWQWLGRWHEPLVVGAAVTLFGLAYLLPVRVDSPLTSRAHGPAPQRLAPGLTAGHATGPSPTDAQFYRDQWAHDAKQFYALHPPRQSAGAQALSAVVPAAAASLTDGRPGTATVSHAYHADPTGRAAVGVREASTAAMARPTPTTAIPQRLKRWRVATCLAAGILASLAFATVWPAAPGQTNRGNSTPIESSQPTAAGLVPLVSDSPEGETLALRLPTSWVRVRPTMNQTLRRGILGGSYAIACLGGWSLFG